MTIKLGPFLAIMISALYVMTSPVLHFAILLRTTRDIHLRINVLYVIASASQLEACLVLRVSVRVRLRCVGQLGVAPHTVWQRGAAILCVRAPRVLTAFQKSPSEGQHLRFIGTVLL